MTPALAKQHYDTAVAMAEQANAGGAETAAMLAEIGVGLMQRPVCTDQIEYAADLFRRALDRLTPDSLQHARTSLQLAAALHSLPPNSAKAELDYLLQARQLAETAVEWLQQHREQVQAAELAEAELNLGLLLQTLAGLGQADIRQAIGAYQRSLRSYTAQDSPAEYALVQNNLASAYLSMRSGDQTDRMREALAVQAFEAALEVVDIREHPTEYAMLQNNLGNALQYATSGHALGNNLRALQAYDEALRVRNERDTPLPFANTQANRALCLSNLPDDPERPELGNRANLEAALQGYALARRLFAAHGELNRLPMVDEAIAAIRSELDGAGFAEVGNA